MGRVNPHLLRVRVPSLTGRVRERAKLFVRCRRWIRNSLCWYLNDDSNACGSDMITEFNAAENLWYEALETFSSGGKATEWSFQLSEILHENRFAHEL